MHSSWCFGRPKCILWIHLWRHESSNSIADGELQCPNLQKSQISAIVQTCKYPHNPPRKSDCSCISVQDWIIYFCESLHFIGKGETGTMAGKMCVVVLRVSRNEFRSRAHTVAVKCGLLAQVRMVMMGWPGICDRVSGMRGLIVECCLAFPLVPVCGSIVRIILYIFKRVMWV